MRSVLVGGPVRRCWIASAANRARWLAPPACWRAVRWWSTRPRCFPTVAIASCSAAIRTSTLPARRSSGSAGRPLLIGWCMYPGTTGPRSRFGPPPPPAPSTSPLMLTAAELLRPAHTVLVHGDGDAESALAAQLTSAGHEVHHSSFEFSLDL